MRKLLLFLCCLCLCVTCSAVASSITLPDGMEEIEEETFAEAGNLGAIVIPDTVKTIGPRAFAGCGLTEITLPASLESIADDAFEGLTDIIVHAEGEVAKTFVSEHPQVFRPTYRALVIGQTYPGTSYELTGPVNDAKAIRSMLGLMKSTPYTVTFKSNLSKAGILSAISSVFADALDCDVSLIYYSGHGMTNGYLVGTDVNNPLKPAELRNALDKIPGKKIIIADCCYSGAMIQRSVSAEADEVTDEAYAASTEDIQEDYSAEAASFVSGFTSAFRGLSRTAGYLNDSPYLVITACAGNEYSWESINGYGYFTSALVEGCGWSEQLGTAIGTASADKNGDGQFTLNEVYSYAAAEVGSRTYAGGYTQTVQVYPSSCSTVIFAK